MDLTIYSLFLVLDYCINTISFELEHHFFASVSSLFFSQLFCTFANSKLITLWKNIMLKITQISLKN